MRGRRTSGLIAGALGLTAALLVPQMSPADGGYTINTYNLPSNGANNNDLFQYMVAAPNGTIWWTSSSTGEIGEVVPSQVSPGTSNGITETSVGGGSLPDGIAAAPDGTLWFSEANVPTKGIDKLDPANGNHVTQVSSDVNTISARDLAFSPVTHDLVMTTQGDKVGTIAAPLYGGFSQTAAATYPYAWSVAVDQSGNTWIAEDGRAIGSPFQSAIGEIKAGTSTIVDYLTPTVGGARAQYLTVGRDGHIWFSERGVDKIGELDPAKVSAGTSAGITEYSIPVAAGGNASQADVNGITTAPDGTIWFAQSDHLGSYAANNEIGRIVPPSGGAAATFTMIPTPNHQGPIAITVDGSGNVWFNNGGSQIGEVVGAGTTTTTTTTATTTSSTTSTTSGPTTTTVAGVGAVHGPPPVVKGTHLNQRLLCVGPPDHPCNVVLNLDTLEEYDTGGLANNLQPGVVNVNAKRRRRVKNVVVGSAHVVLHGGQSKTVTVSLNATGTKLLKRFHKLPATLGIIEQVGARRRKLISARRVTFHR